ncbi:MAG: hypothetical protein RTV72_16290 [Candidatus Thorarchaeota archaeon]
MIQTRIKRKRIVMFLALCFAWIFIFSAVAPLENVGDVQNIVLERIEESHTQSAIDFSPLWNRTYGGFDQDRCYDLTICNEGGYALVGYTESFTGGDKDIWALRTDNDGNVIWSKYFGNTSGDDAGYSIVECENGDFIIGGFSYLGANSDARVDRLDKDGNLLWTTLVGLAATDDLFIDIIETTTDSIIAVGQTSSWGAGGTDVLAVCLDANGNEIWMRTYGGGSEDHSQSIVECDEGGFAILGYTMSYGEGLFDYWLLRLDIDGILLWDCTYGGLNSEQGIDLVQNIFGGFVLVGQSRSLGDANGDFWVISVDRNGNEIWNATYASGGIDMATGIVECARGGYAVIGVIDYISGVDSARLVRIDTDGTQLWSGFYYGATIDHCYSIAEIYPEEFALAGYTDSYGAGSFDAWLLLIPGVPRFDNPPHEVHTEFGLGVAISLFVESTAPLHMWWLEDTSVFDITKVGDNEVSVFRIMPPDVGYYEAYVHVNNTAGHETEHIIFIYVDDTTAPYWQDFTAEHTLEFGDQFQYTPRAGDLSFLGEWFLFGSSYFTIDTNTGDISSVGTPPVGEYNLEINVGDMYHNTLIDDIHILVQDSTAPMWDIVLEDQSIDYGEDFVYNLEASDLAGIASWSVDNTEFSVDSEGRVRNLVPLAPGIHAVTVSVEDGNGIILQGQFTVTVGSRPTATATTTTTTTTSATTTSGGVTPGIIDTALPFVAGVGATLLVVAVVCFMGRRKPPAK